MTILPPGPDALALAVAALESGGFVVLPTDTVYGVARPASDSGATRQLAELKGRSSDQPVAVLVATIEQIAALARLRPVERRAGEAHWPGPLTLILDDNDGGTVGVRIPNHPFVRELAVRVGPLATTSANRHGDPTPVDARAAADSLGVQDRGTEEGGATVRLVVDDGPLTGRASTVARFTADGVEILRSGVGAADLQSHHVPTQEG